MSNIQTYGKVHSEQYPFRLQYTISTNYLLGGSLVMKNGKIDKILFDGGYAQDTSANSTTDKFAFYYYNQDHLGNNREVVDAKVGYTSLTKKFIGKQIQKDALLLKEGTIKGSQWHFFRSPVTGKIGATKPLLKELNRDGFKIIIHF